LCIIDNFKIMKTATLSELPSLWTDILRWVTAGEEVQITDQDMTVARVLPPSPAIPDFLARAQSIWGEEPEGVAMSDLVEEGRGAR
jgi:antitoxin (DNA-binding transcriptional repressor) of toxin-antitoxin stability system